MTTMSWISEPGFWVVIAMLCVTAAQALGALWAKRDFARLRQIAGFLATDEQLSAEDRRVGADLLGVATAWYSTPVVFVVAPLFSIYVILRIFYLLLAGRPVSLETLLGAPKGSGVLRDTINRAFWKSRPIAVLWGILWAVPVLVMLMIIGMGKGIPEIFRALSSASLGSMAHRQ